MYVCSVCALLSLGMGISLISEFFTNPEQYFDFISKLNENLTSSFVTDQSEYDASLYIASTMLGPASLSVLRSSLILRSASPSIETYRMMRDNRISLEISKITYDKPDADEQKAQLYANLNACDNLIALNGKLFCGMSTRLFEIALAQAEEQEAVYDFDHIHPRSKPDAETALIFYADPFSTSFSTTFRALINLMLSGSPFQLVFRPFSMGKLMSKTPNPLFVQGFGVELAIKNMEYKVLDDSKIEYDSDSSNNVELPEEMLGSMENPEEDVQGFYFKTLLNRRPDLSKELDKFRASLLQELEESKNDKSDSKEEEKKVNVWDMKDLGFQTSQRILLSKSPLEVMRDLSQNFPMYAQALTKTKINVSIKNALSKNSPAPGAKGHALPPSGSNFMEINGINLDMNNHAEDVTIYSLIQLMKSEAVTIDELNKLELSTNSIHDLLTLDMRSRSESDGGGSPGGGGGEESPFLLNMDIDSSSSQRIITWLNDIPSDSRYKQWNPSLQEYLAPSWPNQLKYVRKNCYTAVAIIDPAYNKGLEFITQARFFIQNNAPIRIGFLWYIPMQAPSSSKKEKKAVASPLLRGSWDSDLLNKHDSLWSEIIGSEDDEDSDVVDANYNCIQAKIAKIFYHIIAAGKGSVKENTEIALDFLQSLYDLNPGRHEIISGSEVKNLYDDYAKRAGIPSAKASFKKSILQNSELDELVQLNIDYVRSRGFVDEPTIIDGIDEGQMPLMVVNGVVHTSTFSKVFREVMMTAIYAEQYKLMMKIYHGEINDRTDIYKHYQSKPNVMKRINKEITTTSANLKFIPALPPIENSISVPYLTYVPSELDGDAGVYGSTNVIPVSYWLLTDFSSWRGLNYAYSALEYLKKLPVHHAQTSGGGIPARVTFIHNPANATDNYLVGKLISTLLYSPSKTLSKESQFESMRQIIMLARYFFGDAVKLKKALTTLCNTNADLAFLKYVFKSTSTEDINDGQGLNPAFPSWFVSSISSSPGASLLILNGRIINLDSETFTSAIDNNKNNNIISDLKLSTEFYYQNFHMDELMSVASDKEHPLTFVSGSPHSPSNMAWMNEVLCHASYTLIKRGMTAKSSSAFPPYAPDNTAGMIIIENPHSLLNIRVVLDPLSKTAQKLSPLLITLRELFSPNMQIWLNPKSGITEFPLKRFYRYATNTQLTFESDGISRPSIGTFFLNLHTKHILSTVVFTPESWTIALEKAKQDLDNLNINDLGDSNVSIQYEIENLLIFGQCFDMSKGMEPPSGLQLMLSSSSVPLMGDTLVMQNLGYFQLKANPGEWTLSLADQRHADIYEILNNNNNDDATKENSKRVVGYKRSTRTLFVRSFTEGFTRLDVARKPGEEHTQLLDENEIMKNRKKKAGGIKAIWNSVFGSEDEADGNKKALKSPHASTNRTGETIHVFSLASGHLYERFLKIMMLSVIQHTNNPVKFWFIKNFASPQFVEFVPQMAAYYGFEAEFVTYKWPQWLRRQEEKQRIIWGYKILFLDVLFPLHVPKIIYIDADQVVRGDVKELWELDLGGAPYAYTPFCDSNPDTEGFRFWKSGYWKDHLRGKPYHISALYVVDLEQFRVMRAGDSLRGIYDNLSQDPNSLANLDQDLPNYAQHMVPIFSLPQQWLWCQTWCSMETLSDAKTVDLCNNPLTKTPKLEVAKTLLPEWIGLDNEAKGLEPIFAKQHQNY